MVAMIMDRVVERVKEDECLRKVTAQYEQVKLALDELLIKIGAFDAGPNQMGNNSSDTVELFKMVQTTSLDLRRLRQQRNRDYSEAVTRFDGLERALGAEQPELTGQQKPVFDSSISENMIEEGADWRAMEEPMRPDSRYSGSIAEGDESELEEPEENRAPLQPDGR